jgi:hypothetical protein
MKDVLLLNNNAVPHTSLRICWTLVKIGWTVLSDPTHSPDLAPFDYHLFGPEKDAVGGCHFADGNKLKKGFCDVLQSQDREFYNTGIQCLNQCWQKYVEKDEDLEKWPYNCKIYMNHPCKFHCYFNYIF